MDYRLWNVEEKHFNELQAFLMQKPLSAEEKAEFLRQQAKWEPVVITGTVAVINVTGILENRFGLYSWYFRGTTYSKIIRGIQEANQNPQAKTILLNIDSPGGESNGISDVVKTITTSEKPVLGFVSGSCSSAAYWIGSSCKELILAPSSFCGSIGCFVQFLDYSQWLKSLGIEEMVITSRNAPRKNPDPKSEEGKASYQKIVDDVEALFIGDVARGRKVSEKEVKEQFGQGGIFIASEAVDRGMADRIGSFEDVYTEIKEEEIKEEEEPMDIEELRKNHPAVAQSLIDEGKNIGAQEERNRLLALEKLPQTPTALAIIAEAKKDGSTTAEQAALKILNAQGTQLQQKREEIEADGQQVPLIQNGESDDPQPKARDGSEKDQAYQEFEQAVEEGE